MPDPYNPRPDIEWLSSNLADPAATPVEYQTRARRLAKWAGSICDANAKDCQCPPDGRTKHRAIHTYTDGRRSCGTCLRLIPTEDEHDR